MKRKAYVRFCCLIADFLNAGKSDKESKKLCGVG